MIIQHKNALSLSALSLVFFFLLKVTRMQNDISKTRNYLDFPGEELPDFGFIS